MKDIKYIIENIKKVDDSCEIVSSEVDKFLVIEKEGVKLKLCWVKIRDGEKETYEWRIINE